MEHDNEMCDEPYTRPAKLFPERGLVVPVRCTFLVNHGANHSWFALKVADDQALEELARINAQELRATEQRLPAHIQKFLDGIEDGEVDSYLEILLNRLHSRKLFLRNVPGFGRRSA